MTPLKLTKLTGLIRHTPLPRLLLAAGLLVTGLGGATTAAVVSSALASTPVSPSTPATPKLDHVVWIVDENHDFSGGMGIVGSSKAPYFNSLIPQGALATNYYAVTHPSLPNYLALTGGSTFGITDDADATRHPLSAPSIFSRVHDAGKSWKMYAESEPANCAPKNNGANGKTPYYVRHAPAPYFKSLTDCATGDAASNYSKLAADFSSASTTPAFSFIAPNGCHDMHDPVKVCGGSNKIANGDAYLKSVVPTILNSPAFKDPNQHSVLAITWDEDSDDTGGDGNKVATLFLGPDVAKGAKDGTHYTHYSLLHTTEVALGLPTLTANDAGAPLMDGMFVAGAPAPDPTPNPNPNPNPNPGPNPTPPPTTGGLHTSGADILDASGHVVTLRGFSQGPTPLNTKNGWTQGKRPSADRLSPKTLATMRAWGANTVRIPVSAFYADSSYMSELTRDVAAARAAGLYVILVPFDDRKSGSPYSASDLLHHEDITFLSALATQYKDDSGVLFDVLNEPLYTSDAAWTADFNQAIAAIRATGNTSPIVVESPKVKRPVSKTANGVNVNQQQAWSVAEVAALKDSANNLIFSDHRYHSVAVGDAKAWSTILGGAAGHPYLIGEWAALPHSRIAFQCAGLTNTNADKQVNAFLAWSATGNEGHAVSWTAWNFAPGNAIQDNFSSYTPTILNTGSWRCADGSAAGNKAGMGADVKAWLTAHESDQNDQGGITPPPNPNPSPNPTPNPNPNPAPNPSVDPSGEAMPVGDIAGWREVFTDNFGTDVPLGQFPYAVGSKWWAYGDNTSKGWHDTTGAGLYDPARVVSVHNGLMDLYLHTENGVHLVSAPVAKIPSPYANNHNGMLSGRYVIRFKSDALDGYKTAWLLWPTEESSPPGGEIDFPEGNLNETIHGFVHHQGGDTGIGQDAYDSGATYTSWHTAVIEWVSGVSVKFSLDGRLLGTSTQRIPNSPMQWIIQTETRTWGGGAPANSVAGHVYIDWVAVYAHDTTIK